MLPSALSGSQWTFVLSVCLCDCLPGVSCYLLFYWTAYPSACLSVSLCISVCSASLSLHVHTIPYLSHHDHLLFMVCLSVCLSVCLAGEQDRRADVLAVPRPARKALRGTAGRDRQGGRLQREGCDTDCYQGEATVLLQNFN